MNAPQLDSDRLELELSAAGQQRRERIKMECAGRLPGIRTRQRWIKRGASAAALAAVGLLLLAVRWAGTGSDNTSPQGTLVAHNPPVVEHREMEARQPSAKIETIDDDQLLRLLAAAGRPSALGRIDGKLVILPQTVATSPSDSLSP
jgi:hypothetical protein